MIRFFKYIYHKTLLGKIMIFAYHRSKNFLLPERILLRTRFKKRLGKKLNLKKPETFNEKLQWLKLNERNPLHTLCADKYKVRQYVEEKIGSEYLVPLHFMTRNVQEIRPENLPDEPFVIKTNHQSGGVYLIREKDDQDWENLRNNLKRKLETNYYHVSKEWQYKNIEPCVVVEKLLMDKEGNIPPDFKLHCFNGKVGFIQVDLERETEHRRNLYDPEWNFLDFKYLYKNGREVPKPEILPKMKNLAEKIAQDFTFARIDFYVLGTEIYFGEITFHPESGMGKFTPYEWDKEFGKMLNLNP